MLLDELRKAMMDSMKAQKNLTGEALERSTVEKEVLRTAIGDITMAAHKDGIDASDALCLGILKRMIKQNDDTRAVVTDPKKLAELDIERKLLASFGPKQLTKDEIVAALADIVPAIVAAKSDGQAVGVAMKHVKGKGLDADGKVLSEVVGSLRKA